ncbi:MAG: 50S ribosomal protein L4 [Chloroflexi bacterium]|nr:50S ribosomal protein L4 [Chloroflexota bacterium]
MQLPIHDLSGQEVGQTELRPEVFGVPMREAVVHQAAVRQLANKRQGTSATKTRGLVSGSTKKLFQQKHTGRARAGSVRSPLRRHGGIVFGPQPRSYRQRMPKKMRRLALRCALSAKVAAGELVLVEDLGSGLAKTVQVAQMLQALGIGDSSVLIATQGAQPHLVKAARNLNQVKTLPADLLNVLDVLSCRWLLMSVGAVKRAEELWAAETAGSAASSAS